MVIHYNLILIVLLFIFSSCGVQKDVPKYILERFIYCYDGKDTGIKLLMNIDGYYVIAESFKDMGYTSNKDTSYLNILFYENGLCVLNILPTDGKYTIDNSYMPRYLKNIMENPEGGLALGFYNTKRWGKYIVEGETIKAQIIYRPSAGETTKIWGIYEVWYKIINRNTIIEIPSESSDKANKHRKYVPARFVPLIERPKPDCWLIKEDWFRCK